MLILGIIEVGRLLFVYSVVSNAAQEGVRYGIIRPQDMFSVSERQTRVAQGTTIPTVVVVPNGACNIVDKTREKVWGVPRNELIVSVWFDNGDGTPTVVPDDMTIGELTALASVQNRIAVETSYRYEFIVPFMSIFAPSGINIKMRSARTIENFDIDPYNCVMNWVPAPTPPPPPTRTPTFTSTPRPTHTASITPTSPPFTATSTPSRTATPSITATVTRTATVPTVTRTSTAPTATRTNTPPPATATYTNTPVPPTATNTPVLPTATFTRTPVPPTVTRTPSRTPIPTSTPTTGVVVPTGIPTALAPLP